jgi:hypothetical protein
MTDPRAVEDRLADVLREDAERLRPAPVLPPDVHPRVRRRVARNAAVAALAVTLLSAGAVAGVRSIERGTTPPVGSAPVCTWSAVAAPSRDAEGLDTVLRSVVATSPDGALAVGRANVRQEGGHEFLELQQWDGNTWSELDAPGVPAYGTGPEVMSVDASGPESAWAVGFTNLERGGVPLSLHWDGISWHPVGFPDNPQPESHLFAVSAIGDDAVWAVGGWARPGALEGGALVAFWGGSGWNVTDLPTTEGTENGGQHHYDALYGVDGVNGADVWAVGSRFDVPQTFGRSLVEHWDGTSWQRVPSPNVEPQGSGGGIDTSLQAVAATGPDDAWAVGSYEQAGIGDGPPSTTPLAMHWDGETWRIVPVPDARRGSLMAVAAVSSDDVWAVGAASPDGGVRSDPLVMHWDGETWSRPVEPPTDAAGELTSVAAIPGGGLWAVGSREAPGSPSRSLAVRCG